LKERTLFSVLTMMLLLSVMAGCQSPTSGSVQGPTAGTAAQSNAPQAAKRLSAALMSAPTVLSSVIRPLGQGIPGVTELEKFVSAGLTISDDHNVQQPQLAEQTPTIENGLWKLLPDGRMQTTWVMRDNAMWHDGVPVTADDMVFTIMVAQDRDVASFYQAPLDLIESVQADSPRSVTVTWKQPYISADTLFSSGPGLAFALPMPKHLLGTAYEQDKMNLTSLSYWNKDYVGAGPFRVAQWNEGTGVVLTANDQFVLGRPKLDEIDVKFIADSSALVATILAGAVDVTIGRTLSLEQSLQVRDRWQAGGIETGDFTNVILLYPQFINPDPAVVGDVRFRRAMLQAINRQEMADTFEAGLAPAADSYMNPNDAAYASVQTQIVRYAFDPRAAMDAIAGLGYVRGADGMFHDAAGQPLSVELRTTQGDDLQEKSVFSTAQYWQSAGVMVQQNLIPPELANGREYRNTFGGFDLKRQPGGNDFLDRVNSAKTPLPENNFVGNNYNRYMNPEFDALLARYFSTIPLSDRMNVLGQIIHHMTDQVLYLTLFFQASPTVVGSHLKGVTQYCEGWNASTWDLTG